MDFFKRHKNKFLTFGVVSAIGGVGLYVFDKYVESRVAEQREIETQKQLKFVSFTVSHLNLATFKVVWIWLKSLQTNFLHRFYLNCQKTNRNQFSFFWVIFMILKPKKCSNSKGETINVTNFLKATTTTKAIWQHPQHCWKNFKNCFIACFKKSDKWVSGYWRNFKGA